MTDFRYLSVCSGMEAASLAAAPLGWRPLAFAEIEAAPRALLAARYPDVPLHGDFTGLRDEAFIVEADMLCGGTPCQGFSIAGLRGSLSDDRSNLCLEFVRLANAIDDLRRPAGREPCWICWENVPGVLNTDDNAFGAFLGGLVGSDAPIVPSGRWTYAGVVAGPRRCAAWRTLDAQYFGLAQRRLRVFVLAIEHSRGWAAPDALLPVTESLRWHPAPRRETGQRAAGTIEASAGRSRGAGAPPGLLAGTLSTSSHDWSRADIDPGHVVAIQAGALRENPESGPNGVGVQEHIAYTLEARAEVQAIAFDTTQITSKANRSQPKAGDPCHPVTAEGHAPAIAFAMRGREGGAMPEVEGDGERASALRAASGGSSRDFVAYNIKDYNARPTQWAVRRLTPLECERLQGAPAIAKHVILRVCSDLQSSAALAGTKNLKSPRFAWSADGRVLALRAPNADSLFNTPLRDLAKRAALRAQIDLERGEVRLSSATLDLCVSIADKAPLSVPVAAFAQAAVLMTSILASDIQTGAAASPLNMTPSITRLSGSGYAVLCGREISALAVDAARLTSAVAALKFTTSEAGRDSQNSGWTSATSSFCVAAAMSGCIPGETLGADSYDLSIEVIGGYTLVDHRGKPMADGPRYRMIGNSWAVPCVRYIFERVESVRRIEATTPPLFACADGAQIMEVAGDA